MDDYSAPLPPPSSPPDTLESDGSERASHVTELDVFRRDLERQGTRIVALRDQLTSLRREFAETIGLKPR